MNDLLEIRKKLELTNEAMSRLERMIGDQPDSQGLLMNMETMRATYKRLEIEFTEAAKRQGIEVCSYRLFQEESDRQSIIGIGKALINFQSLFSIVYDAVKHGAPKKSGRLSDEVMSETSLDYAYSFPGSVGVAFTVPSASALYGNYYKETFHEVANMVKAHGSQELRTFSRKLGNASVRAMYVWANDLVSAGFGVDVQWKAPNHDPTRLFIQRPELQALREAILATSEERQEEFTFDGTLQGVDVTNRSFHFQYKDERKKKDVRGHFTDAISPSHPVKVPGSYRITIRTTTRTTFSLEEDEVNNLLLRIQAL